MEEKSRNSITCLNALFCFCVIAIHLLSEYMTRLQVDGWLYKSVFVLNGILSFAVPGFLFLSGMKLFGKYGGKPMKIGEFYRGRLGKIVIPYLIAAVIYFLYFRARDWIAWKDFPESVFLGTISAQLYYVVIAVQLYLLFPLIKAGMEKNSIAVLTSAFAVDVLFHEWITFPYSDRFFAPYIFYFVLGMYVAKREGKTIFTRFTWLFFVGAVLFGGIYIRHLYAYVVYKQGVLWETLYICYVTLAVLFLYKIFMGIHFEKVLKFAKVMGYGSYDVYLYHCLALAILRYDVFSQYALSATTQFMVTSAVVFGLAILYCGMKYQIRERKK